MRSLFALFACLTLLLSLGIASSAHALEPFAADAGCAAVDEHGDRDPGAGDDKAIGHVHGCHGHHIAADMSAAKPAPAAALAARLRPAALAFAPAFPSDTALDPPRA